MPDTQTSTTLLEGLRNHDDRSAWRRFSNRYQPILAATMYRAGLRDSEAQDAIQETLVAFLEAYRQGKYERDKGRLRSWLVGIAINKIREIRRRLARREQQPLQGSDGALVFDVAVDEDSLSQAFDEEWERSVMAECLRQVQAQVEQKTFEAFRLFALEGWPAVRVAGQLGMSCDTVYVHKGRVLGKLREIRERLAPEW